MILFLKIQFNIYSELSKVFPNILIIQLNCLADIDELLSKMSGHSERQSMMNRGLDRMG